jgi:hypothetical protein
MSDVSSLVRSITSFFCCFFSLGFIKGGRFFSSSICLLRRYKAEVLKLGRKYFAFGEFVDEYSKRELEEEEVDDELDEDVELDEDIDE